KGMPITIINTHLTHNPQHDWSKESPFMNFHTSQLDQITAFIKGHSFSNNSLILSGDFNVPQATPLFKQFLKETHLTDFFSDFYTPTVHAKLVKESNTVIRIDHIFIQSGDSKIKTIEKKQLFEEQVILP